MATTADNAGAFTRPSPIFILGSARSGTTWLGNLLLGHPDVVGAEHAAHWGILEIALRGNMRAAGDLSRDQQLVEFLERFGTSDYFRLVEGDKRDFYRHPPSSFYDLLFRLMDRFAERRGARYWVVKLDPQLLYRPPELANFFSEVDKRYSSVHLVAITRDFRGVMDSYLNMEGDHSIHALRGINRWLAVFLETGRYVAHNRAIASLLVQRGGLDLRFDDLRSDLEGTLERLTKHLGLPPAEDHVRNRYPPNSSYVTRNLPSGRAALAIASRVYRPAFERAPWLATALLRLRDRTRPPVSPFFYRLLRMETMPERLAEELERTGQTALKANVFGAKPRDGSGPAKETKGEGEKDPRGRR